MTLGLHERQKISKQRNNCVLGQSEGAIVMSLTSM